MATLYTDLANVQLPAAGADTWSREPGVESSGVLLSREAVYTLTAGTDEAALDKIRICKIPANFRIRPDLCKIICNDPGTAFNIAKIGIEAVDGVTDDDDDDQVSVAVDLSAGGGFDLAVTGTVAGLTGYTTKKEFWLVATLGTVTAPTAGQTIRFLITGAVAV